MKLHVDAARKARHDPATEYVITNDQNGHTYLLFTPSVNLLIPAGTANTLGFVGGYTFAGDFLPSTGVYGCPESNQGEIFYLLTPDPSSQWGNEFSTSFVESETRSTMAHEFQHAINEVNRIVGTTATEFESAWLDEALSSMAEDNVSRVIFRVWGRVGLYSLRDGLILE